MSPISENDENPECRSVDSEFDESVDLLASVNKVEMKDTVQCDSAHSTNDVAKGHVYLNITDIGNDTSDDSIMLNNAQLLTNTTNKELVAKSVGAGNDGGKNDTFVSGLDVSAETGDLNNSIDYKSVGEEIAKSTTQRKTEISAADTSEKENANGGNESTLTASKITDTDDEKSVIIPESTSTDGSTLVEKAEFPLPQFFTDSDDISTIQVHQERRKANRRILWLMMKQKLLIPKLKMARVRKMKKLLMTQRMMITGREKKEIMKTKRETHNQLHHWWTM